MRKRIYWLLPDGEAARRTMNELLLARIGEMHIHFAAADGADMNGLHAANVLQTSDIIGSAQIGALVGAGLGAAGGALAAYVLMEIGATPQLLVTLMAGAGAVLGTWMSSMIGSSIPSRRLRRFEESMAAGQYLLMVDVPNSRVTEIEELLAKTHPEAHFEGVEPNVPAFP